MQWKGYTDPAQFEFQNFSHRPTRSRFKGGRKPTTSTKRFLRGESRHPMGVGLSAWGEEERPSLPLHACMSLLSGFLNTRCHFFFYCIIWTSMYKIFKSIASFFPSTSASCALLCIYRSRQNSLQHVFRHVAPLCNLWKKQKIAKSSAWISICITS